MSLTEEPTEQEKRWLAERLTLVGASEAPVILGCHPWSTDLEVWGRKTGRLQDSAGREESLWGQILEDPIAREWSRRTGRAIVDHGRFALRRHPTASHLGCTLDREIVGPPPEALEIKTADRNNDDWREGRAPLHQIVQVQAQLAVTGWQRGLLACLVGRQLKVVEVARDDRLISAMLEEIEDWWEHYVVADVEPPVGGHPRALQAIKALHPRDSGQTIALPEPLEPLVASWEAAGAEEREQKRIRDEIQARLCQALGDATWAEIPSGGRLQWKTQTRVDRCQHCGAEEKSEFRVMRRLTR